MTAPSQNELDKAIEEANQCLQSDAYLGGYLLHELLLAAKRSKDLEKENEQLKGGRIDLARQSLALNQQNNQLRADLKQCAEALERAQRSYRIQYAINIGGLHNMETPYDKALSLPAVQNALKGK